jgi:hypothetical protein
MCPYPEPHPSIPSPPPSHFSKIHFNIILPSTPESPQVASFLQVSPQISSVQLILILRWWKDFWKIYRPLSVKVYWYYTIRDQKLKVVGKDAISYRNTTFYDPLLRWLFTAFGSWWEVKRHKYVLMCVAPCIFVYDYNYLHQQMHYYFLIKHTPRLHVST